MSSTMILFIAIITMSTLNAGYISLRRSAQFTIVWWVSAALIACSCANFLLLVASILNAAGWAQTAVYVLLGIQFLFLLALKFLTRA